MPKHILCADDSATIQKVVAITFGQTDFQLTFARNVDEAVTLARGPGKSWDLVLADAVMPGKSGYDLCLALKSDPALRKVPVVILCGNSSPYDDLQGKAAGVDGHINKPWDTTVFLDKINDLMGRVA